VSGDPEKTLASQALARGGAPDAKSLKRHVFILLVLSIESGYNNSSARRC